MASVRASQTEKVIPFSCSTNLANEVMDHLRQAKLGSRALEFCLYLHRQTFGNAGWHRKHGREEWWCAFDLAAWSVALLCAKSNVRRMRAELEACQIICFEPDPEQPGQGRIGWNLEFAQWQPYDGRRCRPSKQEGVIVSEQSGVIILHPPEAQSGPTARKYIRPVGNELCKIITPASVDGASQEASVDPLRKGFRKKRTETPNVVSETASVSSKDGVGLAYSHQEAAALEPPPVSSLAPLAPQETGGVGAAQSPVAASLAAASPPAAWPPKQAWERTDLDYFQRVLREHDKARVALLTRLAHDHIGVALETASYARIGALAKQCGAALLVKHILLAAATHIDGEPLDYLTKLARGRHRKEEAHGDRSQARPSASQPYTAEEAAQLTWRAL